MRRPPHAPLLATLSDSTYCATRCQTSTMPAQCTTLCETLAGHVVGVVACRWLGIKLVPPTRVPPTQGETCRSHGPAHPRAGIMVVTSLARSLAFLLSSWTRCNGAGCPGAPTGEQRRPPADAGGGMAIHQRVHPPVPPGEPQPPSASPPPAPGHWPLRPAVLCCAPCRAAPCCAPCYVMPCCAMPPQPS